jgi:hypothetical protein
VTIVSTRDRNTGEVLRKRSSAIRHVANSFSISLDRQRNVFAMQVNFGQHLDTRMRESKDYSDLQRSGYICCS